MNTPCCSAAAITSWPLGAVISRPLTVSVTASSGTRGLRCLVRETVHLHGRFERATDIRLELVAKAPDGGRDRRHGGGTERTDRGLPGRPADAGADVVAHVEEQVDAFGTPVAIDAALQRSPEHARS